MTACLFALVMPVRAQDPPDAKSKLSAELASLWVDCAVPPAAPLFAALCAPVDPPAPAPYSRFIYCLQALDLYTKPLATTADQQNALAALMTALQPDTVDQTIAQRMTTTPTSQLLMGASRIKIDTNNPASVVFGRAGAGIAEIFKRDYVELDNRLEAPTKAKAYPRVLYALLKLTWDRRYTIFVDSTKFPGDTNTNALNLMEVFRTCYAIAPERLAGLISGVLNY
jgi:hypothetical protein